ncbi:MAG: hypothetical protein ABR880_17925 [Candidatus Sulfotelmatobacter sp.]|jgi:hypothetical protein
MNWQDVFNALEFQNQRILNDKIDSIPAVQTDSFVSHRQWHLALEPHSAEMQFMTEALFIGRFHKTRAKFAMHFDRGANDLFSELFM